MTETIAAHLLNRHSHRKRSAQALTFLGDLTLDRGRIHELCGGARRRLALKVAGALQGPVFWIRPAWGTGQLNPEGMLGLIDPSRILFLTAKRPEDLLWVMEESLRAGPVPLTVADLPAPPGLTAVRRLHLAAETGAREGSTVPLGLILTPDQGGAPGVESRWSLNSDYKAGGRESWKLARLRARMQPEKSWTLSGATMQPD